MGYTHYWKVVPEIDKEVFAKIANDFKKLRIPLDKKGVILKGPQGTGAARINDTEIIFNGDSHCGHPQNHELGIVWPAANAGGVSAGQSTQIGDWFAGAQVLTRCCGGQCSHESFVLEQKYTTPSWAKPEPDGKYFEFCKTAFKPYDLAVTAALVIAKNYLGDKISIHSDGEEVHWFDAKMLCKTVLGYGLNFTLDKEGE